MSDSRRKKRIGVGFVLLTLLSLLAWLCLPFYQVVGTSMEPTLREDDVLLCLQGSGIERFDLVTFEFEGKSLVKRVIALSGERVWIDAEGQVEVNGERLAEPYVSELAEGKLSIELPCTVPEGCYFLMGDNRSVSEDSRNAALGCVSGEDIRGRVSLRLWPLREFGKIE